MMRTPRWPASWKARIRWSGTPRPTWMSGEVTSMPSLTRTGRPSASLRSRPPAGSTSTAFRVSWWIGPGRPPILEVVGQEVLRAERVPDAEGEAREREGRCEPLERAADAGSAEREAPAGRERRHRQSRAEGEQRQGDERERVA